MHNAQWQCTVAAEAVPTHIILLINAVTIETDTLFTSVHQRLNPLLKEYGDTSIFLKTIALELNDNVSQLKGDFMNHQL